MLDLSTAVLCDFAQVRDRLLFVSSGAVSRLYRQELPSPLGLMVGLVIEVPLEDAGMEHQLRAEVINRHGTVLATLENTFRVSDAGLFPHEVQQVPLVLSITGVRARTWGTHQVRLYLDNELVRALTLYVVPAQGPAPTRTPTQSRADDTGTVAGGAPEAQAFPPDPEPAPAPAPVAAPAPAPAPQPQPAAPADEKVVVLADDPLDALDALDAPIVFDDPVQFAPAPQPAPAPQVAPQPALQPAPAPQPVVQAPPPPAPDEAVDWGGPATAPPPPPVPTQAPAPAPAPAPAFDPGPPPAPQPAPQHRAPVISAPPAAEPRVYDFDEDDLDADPAQRPPAEDDSRFSFRYLEDES